jgi:hypothetical protein
MMNFVKLFGETLESEGGLVKNSVKEWGQVLT